MSFSERVINLVAYLKQDVEFWQNTALLKRYKNQIDCSVTDMHDLLRLSSLFLITTDHIIDWHIPGMPHLIYDRGITTNTGIYDPDCKIKRELEQTDSTWNGAIVVSLGTALDVYPDTLIKAISTFATEYKLITFTTRLKEELQFAIHAPYETRNQVLGHKKVILLITSGNNEDQSEALYHGVPVLTVPLYGDDFHNARRVVQRGLGEAIYLDKHKYNVDGIITIIHGILRNGNISKNTKLISELMHATPTDHWISTVENIIKFGDYHVRSVSLDMPLAHYAMLDLAVIMCLIAVVTFSMISRVLMKYVRFFVGKLFLLIIRIMVGVIRDLFKIVSFGVKSKKE